MSAGPSLEAASELEARVLSPARLSGDELARWEALAAREPELRSPFLSPSYARAVDAVRGGARVCVLRRGGDPSGFLAFQFPTRAHRLVASAEPMGGEMTDAFALVAEPDLRITPRALLRSAGLASLYFTHLFASQSAFGLTGERAELGLAIDLAGGGAAYWDELRARNKDFVDKTERRERKLARELGALTFRFEREEPLELLHELVARKRDQYRRTGAADALAESWRRELLARLATSRAPGCTGVLSTLHAGDTPVAYHFGLRSGELLQYWFPVYNPDLAKHSPGRLLLKAILLAADEHGLARIDRGAGDTPAKREFANVERTYASGLWQRPGLRSSAFRAYCSIAWRAARRAE